MYEKRRHIHVGHEKVDHISNPEFPGHYHDEENAWDLAKFKQVRRNRKIIVPRVDMSLARVETPSEGPTSVATLN